MKYDCYRRVAQQRILRASDVSFEKAKAFLRTERFGEVDDEDFKTYSKIEELENAKRIRSHFEPKLDIDLSEFAEVPEDSDRELSESDQDRTE